MPLILCENCGCSYWFTIEDGGCCPDCESAFPGSYDIIRAEQRSLDTDPDRYDEEPIRDWNKDWDIFRDLPVGTLFRDPDHLWAVIKVEESVAHSDIGVIQVYNIRRVVDDRLMFIEEHRRVRPVDMRPGCIYDESGIYNDQVRFVLEDRPDYFQDTLDKAEKDRGEPFTEEEIRELAEKDVFEDVDLFSQEWENVIRDIEDTFLPMIHQYREVSHKDEYGEIIEDSWGTYWFVTYHEVGRDFSYRDYIRAYDAAEFVHEAIGSFGTYVDFTVHDDSPAQPGGYRRPHLVIDLPCRTYLVFPISSSEYNGDVSFDPITDLGG